MKSEEQLRLEMRNTPAGQFLWSMGRDYYDTESAARRVAEEAVERIAAMSPAAQACAGLDLHADVPPGTLADAVKALDEIGTLLAGHPEAKRGNSKVHFAMHRAKGVLATLYPASNP